MPPKVYRSLADFYREEIRPHMKAGWSLDDLFVDALMPYETDPFEEGEEELDFEDDCRLEGAFLIPA